VKRVVLINIILALLIIVASIFGYFYFIKRDLSDILQNYLPDLNNPSAVFVGALSGENPEDEITPSGLTITSDGKMFISDYGKYRVVIWDLNGRSLGEFGSYGDKPGQFKFPYGIISFKGQVYVADPVNGRISVFTPDGGLVKIISSPEPNKLYGFAALAADGDRIYATDVVNHQVVVLDAAGKVVEKFGQKGTKPGELYYPNGIAVRDKRIYVADSNNNRIEIFTDDGVYQENWLGTDKEGSQALSHPRGMFFDQSGKLLVVNMMASKVTRLNKSGVVDYHWGKQGSGDYEFFMPLSLTSDISGKIYIGDNLNHRISIFKIE